MPKYLLILIAALLTTAGIGQGIRQTYLPAIIAPAPTTTAIATATNVPTSMPTTQADPTPTRTPTVTPTATTAPSGPCPCHADVLNCSNFSTQSAAQACMDYCISQGRGDIHNLDGNADGEACESLPGGFQVVR